MPVISRAHFWLVSTHICFNLLLLLPAALEVLIYEVTCFFGFCFFFFLRPYDSTIISFCVRIEYSLSVTQKGGLDWTLLTFYFSEFISRLLHIRGNIVDPNPRKENSENLCHPPEIIVIKDKRSHLIETGLPLKSWLFKTDYRSNKRHWFGRHIPAVT